MHCIAYFIDSFYSWMTIHGNFHEGLNLVLVMTSRILMISNIFMQSACETGDRPILQYIDAFWYLIVCVRDKLCLPHWKCHCRICWWARSCPRRRARPWPAWRGRAPPPGRRGTRALPSRVTCHNCHSIVTWHTASHCVTCGLLGAPRPTERWYKSVNSVSSTPRPHWPGAVVTWPHTANSSAPFHNRVCPHK